MNFHLPRVLCDLICSYLDDEEEEEEEEEEGEKARCRFHALFEPCHPNGIFFSFYYFGNIPPNNEKRHLRLALERLCKTGNVEAVSTFLFQLAGLGSNQLRTILDYAAKNGHWDLVRFFLKQGGNEFQKKAQQVQCLYLLARYSCPTSLSEYTLFQDLFQQNTQPFQQDIDMYYSAAIDNGNVSILQFLFDRGHMPTKEKTGDLYKQAASTGHIAVLAFFAKSGLCDTFPPSTKETKAKVYVLRYSHLSDFYPMSHIYLEAYDAAAANGQLEVLLYLEQQFPTLKNGDFSTTKHVHFIQIEEHFQKDKSVLRRRARTIFYHCLVNQRFSEAKFIWGKYKIKMISGPVHRAFSEISYQLESGRESLAFLGKQFPKRALRWLISEGMFEEFQDFLYLMKTFPFLRKQKEIEAHPFWLDDSAIHHYVYYKLNIRPIPYDPVKQFEDAAVDGNVEQMKYLVETHCIVEKKEDVEYLLCKVAYHGHLQMIQFLLHTFPFLFDEKERNRLLKGAVRGNQFHIAKYVLEELQGSDVHWNFGDASFCLIEYGFLDLIKLFLEYNVLLVDKTSLERAAEKGHFSTIKYLCEKVSLLSSSAMVESLFVGSANGGHVDILSFLVNRHVLLTREIIIKSFREAVKKQHVEIVEFLLHERFPITDQDIQQIAQEALHLDSIEKRELYLYFESFLNKKGLAFQPIGSR